MSGFTAQNQVYPDDRAAVVVLTNLDATGASSQIASRISTALFRASVPVSMQGQALARAKTVFEGLQHSQIDRALFTSNANAYFSDATLTVRPVLVPLDRLWSSSRRVSPSAAA